jgi:glycosyltransferase involved in cell wall biosynthesis
MPPRVTMLTPSYPRFPGDYNGSFIRELARIISRKDICLKILAPRTRTLEIYPEKPQVKRFPYLPFQKLEVLPEQTMKGAGLDKLIQIPFYLLSGGIHSLSSKCDIMHVHLAIPLGFVAALTKKTPMIITCHGSDCTLPQNKKIYRPFTRYALDKADRIIAVSDYIRNQAINLGIDGDRIETIYMGVDTGKFKPGKCSPYIKDFYGVPDDVTIMGTLSRLVPEKRVEELIYAANILNKLIDAHYVIGGDGPELPRLKFLAKKLGVTNITFTGRITKPWIFYRLLDFFVSCSVTEGLSMVLQESMATGCVPIGANATGTPELIVNGGNGYLYQPGKGINLATKLLIAFGKKYLGKNARETIVKHFNIEKNSERYIEVYHELYQD